MRIALISLCREVSGDDAGYSGLLPIGNDSLLAYQISLAKRAGADMVLCHVDTVPGDLMRHEKMALAGGMQWQTIRHFGDLLANVMADDELLVIGDGIYHTIALFDKFLAIDAPSVMVAQVDNDDQGFERLDLNHVWAGLLLVNREQLDGLSDVPSEWSLESVLLRSAMTGEAQSFMVPGDAMDHGDVRPLEGDDVLKQIHKGFLSQSHDGDPSFNHPLSDMLVTPLTRAAANWIWGNRSRGGWLVASGMILLVAMLALFAVKWSIMAAIIGYFGYLAVRIARLLDQPVPSLKATAYHGRAIAMLVSLGIGLSLYTDMVTIAVPYTALIWLSLQGFSSYFAPLPKWKAVAFDPLVLAVLAATAAAFGQLLIAFMGLTLAQAAMLLVQSESKA
ncbi:hypothetical protein [Alterisphingorhabdus coralli]|uniref:Uncharacterized protein n=1 Tax=Alterisphingorhabdus coralli TaxID=3071408 RepID=A0AA97I005_9SPHN|nr:hypothetical protein [Parasphingorhabdus sp. SCSIO 66989]WOE73938.1 hypothetical protein RB602_08680 [Parasphingorhabdus sp. SCSIO 66989]